MSSSKKLRDSIDKYEIELLYKKKPKLRCPKCHKFSLFFRNEESKVECIRCHRIIE